MNKPFLAIAGVVIVAFSAAGWWYAHEATPHKHQLVKMTSDSGKVYYTCPMHPQVKQPGPGKCPICGMQLSKRVDSPADTAGSDPGAERKPLYWYDPMKPEQHFDKPGKSPFMDMELVPKYAEGEAATMGGDTVVSIDPRMAQNLGMRTGPVTRGTFWQRIDTVGSVALDETRIVAVESRAAGWVERLDVRAVGETVKRGQVIAGVYAPDQLAAKEELVLAEKLGDARMIEAARSRLELLGVPGQSGTQRRVAITAPQSGVVTELMVREGAQLTPGTPLMKLADLSKVWILVEVPESQSAWIAAGKAAEARLRAVPGKTFEGTVDYVYPILDAQTRTLRARLVFDNSEGTLKPGMYADVTVFGGANAEVTLVPSEAVIRTGTRSVVLVAEELGRYRPVEVQLGAERNDQVVVLKGLEVGQEVVISGQFLIDSEASLLGAYNRMGESQGERSVIARLIHWSVHNRFLVLLGAVLVTAWGVTATLRTPLDALPDLSDTQVIVRTMYPGQAPQVVEDQVTYPLTTTLLSVPHAKTVRGYSLFGESFVYVLFEDGVDLYWARSRVLEYLSQVQGRLPVGARAALGPDATGVGWIYEYALVDRSGKTDIAQLRALQDWFLKYELKSVENVAEVATLGGFNRQYQIVLDPDRLRAYKMPIETVVAAVQAANGEAGGSVLELAEAEYMVRTRGYLKTLADFRDTPVGLGENGTPILLRDVATVQIGPETRRGVAELDGEGEVVGGVIVLRSGENARSTIQAVKAKLQVLKASLPAGVEIVETYDRSQLIERAVENLSHKLLEEFLVVALVCGLFLWHLRSALVAIITLPIGILVAFIVMHAQGINANIMSLGGIAIAIGAMVDAAVVMIENAHKKLEHWRHQNDGKEPQGAERVHLMAQAAAEVGPALFFSLLIITLSFIPVFTLEAQEGRLFAPLAYTKTFAMAAAAGLSLTLIPVLMVAFIRGRIVDETANPLNRMLIALYRPVIDKVLQHPYLTLLIAAVAALATIWPATRLGSEFMPPLDEGDLLYMPTALPGLAVGKGAQILQQTDRILKTFPEVQRVFGKIGRAETATDPAPLEMVETTVMLKPKSEWRAGLTTEKLIEEMDAALKLPGMGNVWVQPIRNRIDMLATGIKSPVGIKIAGPDLGVIQQIGNRIEAVVKKVPGTVSAFSERVSGGRYIEVTPDRIAAARYGMSIADVQRVVSLAVGGENIGETVEGLQRFPINLRYPRELRDSVQDLRDLPVVTMRGETITLGSLANVAITDGPPMIKSENARPNGWIYVDIRNRDLGGYVADAKQAVAEQVPLPAGYSVAWSGQFEYLERATKRLRIVVPFTLAIIFLLLYLTFRSAASAALIMGTLPFALVGGFWLIYVLGHHLSVASGVGFIALAGVAAEFGVVMLIYLDQAIRERRERGQMQSENDLRDALIEGAVLRVRPKAMTVAVIIAGLVPLFIGAGAGSEVMQRIAAPMIGGMITAPLLSMFVVPAAYLLLHRRRLRTALPA